MEKMNVSLKEQATEFWNRNPCGGGWQRYREFMAWIQRTERYIYGVLDNYEWQDKSVLEVGCGQGSTLNYLPGLGARVYGIDISEDSLAKAKAGAEELGYASRVKLSIGDAEHLPFEDEFFDAIICLGVLHHTVDTAGGVREIFRVLKPGGFVIVMLYRSGNPKWWATKLLRELSFLFDKIQGEIFVIAERLRQKKKDGNQQGTALLELFGVPIIKAFTNEECRRMFADFKSVNITNHQPGFERNCDIIRALEPFRNVFRRIDRAMKDRWGFYQVIEARK
jgi:ubiquinone/menaquinone biosynthesis C-methylase UbiE